MAHQHQHGNHSQHISHCSFISGETQCHVPQLKHNPKTALQFATKHHDEKNQWNKQHTDKSCKYYSAEGPILSKVFITKGITVAPFNTCFSCLEHSHSLSPRLIPTLLNVRRRSWISNHHVCTSTASKIKHMEIHTLTINRRWIHDCLTLQITISHLPSASLPGFMNTRTPNRFGRNIMAYHATTRTTPTPAEDWRASQIHKPEAVMHHSWTHPKYVSKRRHSIPINQETIGSNQQCIQPHRSLLLPFGWNKCSRFLSTFSACATLMLHFCHAVFQHCLLYTSDAADE